MSPRIKVYPGEKEIEVPEGGSLLEALVDAGYYVEALCGGRGTCGRCAVKVLAGVIAPGKADLEALGESAVREGLRLACRARVTENISVKLEGEAPLVPGEWSPYLDEDEIRSDTLKKVGEGGFVFQTGETKVFLGKITHAPIGVAVDGGTTSVEALFVDLASGRVIGSERRMNRQVTLGADVVSRIEFALRGGENLYKLRKLFLDTLADCLNGFLRKRKLHEEDLVAVALSGNIFITYSFLGYDMKPLSRFPFAPPFMETLSFDEEGVIPMNRSGAIILFPAPGAFVGGDATAGITSIGLDVEGPPEVFMDIGTNTEIAVAGNGGIYVTSVPSGGAFEGAEIECGMMALPGAINDVSIKDSVSLSVVGREDPRGISGSGLVSAVAELLKNGILDRDGRLLSRSEAQGKVSDGQLWRLIEVEGEPAYLLYIGERGNPNVYLTQKDIRSFQAAKSATRAAVELLLDRAGVGKTKVRGVYIAGAFGKGVREEALFSTGMLPPEFRGKVKKVGNTSIRGAYRALTEREFLKRARECVEKMKLVHLGGESDFEKAFLSFLDF